MCNKLSITPEIVKSFIRKTVTQTIGDNTTLVICTLINGFILTETTSCPKGVKYNVALGERVCMNKIHTKIRDYLGFLQRTLIMNHGVITAEIFKGVNTMKLFINPGHKVGIDPGCVHPNGTTEAEIALELGEKLIPYLENAGVDCKLLQSNSLNGEDEDINNPSICRTANESGADLFLSLHCNGFNHKARGIEALVYPGSEKSKAFAKCLLNQLYPLLSEIDPDFPNRGIKERSDLAVLRNTSMPACLLEVGFVDNDADLALLKNHQDDIVRAIARAVTDWQLEVY